MTTFLPKEVAEGLEAARKQALRKTADCGCRRARIFLRF